MSNNNGSQVRSALYNGLQLVRSRWVHQAKTQLHPERKRRIFAFFGLDYGAVSVGNVANAIGDRGADAEITARSPRPTTSRNTYI